MDLIAMDVRGSTFRPSQQLNSGFKNRKMNYVGLNSWDDNIVIPCLFLSGSVFFFAFKRCLSDWLIEWWDGLQTSHKAEKKAIILGTTSIKKILNGHCPLSSDSPPTVGQDVDELICENSRKTRQNQAIAAWTLLSTKPEWFLMKAPKKIYLAFF